MKGMKKFFLFFVIALAVPALWNSLPIIKSAVHFILDPTAGFLLNWNVHIGMVLLTAILTFIITLVQKYTIDQEAMRSLKAEQKKLQEEMKQYKDNPEKLLELQKKSLEFIPRTFELTLKSSLYTVIPIILFFRWFQDYFTSHPAKIFGFMGWFLAYLILAIFLSIPFRKIFKLP